MSIPGLVLRDLGADGARCGIVTFTVDGVDASTIAAALRARAVNVGLSTIDFARTDFERRGLDAVVRASAHYYNTEDEIGCLVAELQSIVAAT